jgi:hypothetical protein
MSYKGIYEFLESQEFTGSNLVMSHEDTDSYFARSGCDCCNWVNGKTLGNTVKDIVITDIPTGATFDAQLCNDCEYEFEYPNESQGDTTVESFHDESQVDDFYASLSSHAIPDIESTNLPCGNNLFYYLKNEPGVKEVVWAVISGCESPGEINEFNHTLQFENYICTDTVLEHIAHVAHKLLNTESSGVYATEIQFGFDCLLQEITDSVNGR